MEKYFRFKGFWVRLSHSNPAGLHRLDKKIEDRYKESCKNAGERLKQIYEPAEFVCNNHAEIRDSKYNLQIIIPAYNAQRYIEACLDSIFLQKTKYTYTIVMIDDGSTDLTTFIVEKRYKNKNLRVLRQANQGTASARNEGLSVIEADYVMFVDADDVLKQDAIEKLLDKAYETDACLVEGGYEVRNNGFYKAVTHQEEEVKEPCGTLWGFSWAKVYKASLFSDVCFPAGYWYEDTIVSYILHTKCAKAYTIKDVVYKYRKNVNGFSHIRGNDVKLLDSFWVLFYVLKEMQRRGTAITQTVYESILQSIVTCCKRLLFMNDEIRREVLEAFSELLNDDFKDIRSENEFLSVFEKTVRNNDYNKFRKVLPYMKE